MALYRSVVYQQHHFLTAALLSFINARQVFSWVWVVSNWSFWTAKLVCVYLLHKLLT